MSLKVSTGLTLTTDYFMRNFYRNNRDAIKDSGRGNFSKIELSFEDSRALSHAARRLMTNDYGTEEDDDKDIDETTKASIEAFVNIYNNALKTGDSDDHETAHCLKQLKSLLRKNADDLEEIGISIEKNGSLSINDDLLKMADTSKVRKVFNSETGISKKAWNLSKKLNTAVQSDLYSKMTGNGLRFNITT